MRFFQILASGAALIASALAQSNVIQINNYPQTGVIAGQSYTVTYSPADNVATTFILRKGPSGDLGTVGTLTTSATGGSFTWNVASSLVNGNDYALEIRRGSEVNYSAQFSLSGGSGIASSAVSSAVSSARSSAVSSAASSAASAASSSVASSSRVSGASSAVITSHSSMMTSASSVSGVISSTASRNSTVSTSRPTGTSSATLPESTGAAALLASSPLALIFGAVAAMVFLN